ncbi:histidine triad nucleotide-binding protein 1-like [Grus japonensis]|uniref:Histidine triad nucleotide-binding protein 1-like n=1 Tax=Grus japonensis TaxID=30415 RepID=A0ABC9YD05_GRUJA
MGAAEGLAEWRKREGDNGRDYWGAGGATAVFGKVTGKALRRPRHLRGRGGTGHPAGCKSFPDLVSVVKRDCDNSMLARFTDAGAPQRARN